MKPAAQWIEEYTRDKHTGNERLRQSRMEEFITAIQRDAMMSGSGDQSLQSRMLRLSEDYKRRAVVMFSKPNTPAMHRAARVYNKVSKEIMEEIGKAINAPDHLTGSVSFDIYYPGEMGAGLRSFSDEVTVTCKSGQWGGVKGEFESHMQECLKEWYDGATVTNNDPSSEPRTTKGSKC